VEDLVLAHKIWSTLQNFHERTNQVKARLFETYRREYENFSHLPGETTDTLFHRFVSIVNKMKANVIVLPYTDHDQAMKLLHSLDRGVWGTKVDAIIESAGYETLSTNELFSKLKSTEVDIQLRTKHEGHAKDPNSLALVTSSGQAANANSRPSAFALSALLSVTEEQLEEIGDDELALFAKKIKRFSNNRKERWRSKNTCFECGRLGHFAADCPYKEKGKYDSHKYKSKSPNKKKKSHKKGDHKNKKKYKEEYRKLRAFAATMSDHDDSTTSNATSSDSSSSEEEVVVKQKKKAVKNFNVLCYFATNRNPDGYCLMAKDSKDEKNNDSSDFENESEVRTYDELVLEVESLTYALNNRNKLIKDTKARHTQFKIDLENAAKEIELLKSAVSELDELKAAQSKVAKIVSAECSECTTHMLDLVTLQSKYAVLVEERDVAMASLNELVF